MHVRVEREDEAEAIARVIRAAFGGEEEVVLVERVRASEGFFPRLSWVAEVDGEVVGHSLLSRAHLRTEAGREPILALAPVAVSPPHQRGGIGTALVREGLVEAERLGERLVVVLGHAAYYPRFGFVRASTMGISSPFEGADESFMALALRGDAARWKGLVEYPPAFDVAARR